MKKVLFILMLVFTINSSFAENVALVIGMDKECYSCGPDAQVMRTTLEQQNFEVTLLMNPKAESVLSYLDEYANTLSETDIFVLYYSGHGNSHADTSGDETDGYDESWSLDDYSLLDDTVWAYLTRFNFGVKIVFLSDSCHSGSMYKFSGPPPVYPSKMKEEEFKANLIAITSSADDETSLMGSPYSQFTDSLIQVWNEGNFQGNYIDLYEHMYEINLTRSGRHVQYYSEGFTVDTFESMIPFSNY